MENQTLHLPLEVRHGIELVNQGKYFQAHEVLEFAWRQASDEVRQLYQGLVQVSVMLYHLERDNKKGAYKLLCMARDNITPFLNISIDLDISRLVSNLSSMAAELVLLHEDKPSNIHSQPFKVYLLRESSDDQ